MGAPSISVGRGSSDFSLLDTNKGMLSLLKIDGVVNQNDDPYSPYYPGDEYVDWVGISVYHFGFTKPFYDNTVPLSNEVADFVTSKMTSTNFYNVYCARKGKPMMLSESAFGYNPSNPKERGIGFKIESKGLSELQLKKMYWDQYLTNATFLNQFPMLKMITLFEYRKEEYGRIRDFRLLNQDSIRTSFIKDFNRVKDDYYVFGSESGSFWKDQTPKNITPAEKNQVNSRANGTTALPGVTQSTPRNKTVEPPRQVVQSGASCLSFSWLFLILLAY